VFTGIIQAVASIAALRDQNGLRTFTLDFPEGFCQDLAIGASVSTDGVCLTVTEILSPTRATFDVMLQSLNITTLGGYAVGGRVNVERAAKDGAEIGGHPLSGHVEMRYAPEQQRVVYQPVTIEPREITPRIIREDNYGGLH